MQFLKIDAFNVVICGISRAKNWILYAFYGLLWSQRYRLEELQAELDCRKVFSGESYEEFIRGLLEEPRKELGL